MARSEHLAILRQGVETWNKWRANNPLIRPALAGVELPRADFYGIDLHSAYLRGSDLREANFGTADLGWTDLTVVDLIGADLRGASLVNAQLNRTLLDGANLNGANLTRASVERASMFGADLRNATLESTKFYGTDAGGVQFHGSAMGWTRFDACRLHGAEGLVEVQHRGPSSIAIDTIFLSHGKIPDDFLRGAGVPRNLLDYLGSLVGDAPIQYYSCFISHSSQDKEFCDRLYSDLKARQVRVWYFPETAKWGESVWEEIDQGIRLYDKLILVCSLQSLQSSPVLREIERALWKEDIEHRNVLFPIRVDDFIFDGWEHARKTDVASKVVGDFCGWKGDLGKYKTSLRKLLSALNAEPG